MRITLAIRGGLAELCGIYFVAKGIRDDRRAARASLRKRMDIRAGGIPRPRRFSEYDVRVISGASVEPREEARVIHIAALATQLGQLQYDSRKELDERTQMILQEIDKGDQQLRAGLLSVRDRVIGVAALATGVALATAGSVLGTLA